MRVFTSGSSAAYCESKQLDLNSTKEMCNNSPEEVSSTIMQFIWHRCHYLQNDTSTSRMAEAEAWKTRVLG
jgi:hypothetical protein